MVPLRTDDLVSTPVYGVHFVPSSTDRPTVPSDTDKRRSLIFFMLFKSSGLPYSLSGK